MTSLPRRSSRRPWAAVAVSAAVIVALGCAGERDSGRAFDPALAVSGARLEGDGVDPGWVALYDPGRAWNGFTLALLRKQVPVVIDMNGRLAHAWPAVRARSRVRLLDDCSLLTIASAGRRVQQFSWDGELVWEYALEDRLPHHDVIRLANGNTLLVVLREEQRADDLLEVDPEGELVWEWRAGDRLATWLAAKRSRGKANLTHINSVQELPANPWFDAGDPRFRPGNLLISARNLDALFVIDRASGEVVWSLEAGLDQQHEALMNGPALPRPGYVQLFNNNPFTSRTSAVLEMDPRDQSIVWVYRSEGFFSATKGAQQALPNSNVLVTSSRGWRSFEVTRAGHVVWQWTPPFEPQRPRRYARDHCGELERLGDPAGTPVVPPAGYGYVDRELYELSNDKDQAEIRVAGERLPVLRFTNRCRKVLLPPGATLDLSFGLAPERIPSPKASASFRAHLEDADSGSEALLLDETIASDDLVWRERSILLVEHSQRGATLCLAIEESPAVERDGRFAYWGHAAIRPGTGPASPDESDGPELSEQEIEERRQHLRTMGYVD